MKLSIVLTEKLLNDKIISNDERDIIEYGFSNLEVNFLGLLLILAVSTCFGDLNAGFFLWLLNFPLRKNAGGYHANTKIGCFFMSISMLIIAFFILYQYQWSNTGYIIIALLFAGIIFFLAPIENPNKRLDKEEQKVYRKRSRIILGIELLIFAWVLHTKWNKMIIVSTMNYSLEGISLLTGIIKDSHNKVIY